MENCVNLTLWRQPLQQWELCITLCISKWSGCVGAARVSLRYELGRYLVGLLPSSNTELWLTCRVGRCCFMDMFERLLLSCACFIQPCNDMLASWIPGTMEQNFFQGGMESYTYTNITKGNNINFKQVYMRKLCQISHCITVYKN